MLNMDFSQRLVIATAGQQWLPSPSGGVERKPLAREEAERGHATSVVRYLPGASFKRHEHPLGEEILVLEGIFSDETGDYPAGTYLRNPPGTGHAPFSRDGCTLLVKLHQFAPDDRIPVRVDTRKASWQPREDGLEEMPLHEFGSEKVSLLKWPAGAPARAFQHAGGEEIFVLSGELQDESGRYAPGTWIRNPPGSLHHPGAEQETLIWFKSGHLPLS